MISPDGSRVAYLSRPNGGEAIQIWDAAGGAPRKLCDACGTPIQWMPDGKRLLVAAETPPRLQVWNALTGENHNLLPALKHPIRDVATTPDGRWMAITTRRTPGVTPDGCPEAFLVPFEVESSRSCNDWLALTGLGSIWGVRWSQAGDLLYFFSLRDGRRCVWAQHLPLPSRRPVGKPFAVQHFHRYQPSPWSGGGISTAGGRLAVWFQDAQSSIWMAELH